MAHRIGRPRSLKNHCRHGYLDHVQEYLATHNVSDLALREAFHIACRHDHRPLVEWLAREMTTPEVRAEGCAAACALGNLDLVQYLFREGSLPEDSREECWSAACREGQLEIAQWLVTQGPVDVWRDHNAAFKQACGRGDLPMIEWLVQLVGPQLHTTDIHPFSRACYRRQTKTVHYLLTLGLPHDEWLLRHREDLDPEISEAIEEAFQTAGVDIDAVEGYAEYAGPDADQWVVGPQGQVIRAE